jgi:hypothetical protein
MRTIISGELLFGFFDYYNSKFDFTSDCGSIRRGKIIPIENCHRYAKDHNLVPGQWSAYACMEEPFNRSNAGRAVIKRPQFDKILDAIGFAYWDLDASKCLDCLLKCCQIH